MVVFVARIAMSSTSAVGLSNRGNSPTFKPCPNKHANMSPVAGPRAESRIVIDRDWKTFLRSSANNTLTRLPSDVPRANFASNALPTNG
jgi:hypothetical protein